MRHWNEMKARYDQENRLRQSEHDAQVAASGIIRPPQSGNSE